MGNRGEKEGGNFRGNDSQRKQLGVQRNGEPDMYVSIQLNSVLFLADILSRRPLPQVAVLLCKARYKANEQHLFRPQSS